MLTVNRASLMISNSSGIRDLEDATSLRRLMDFKLEVDLLLISFLYLFDCSLIPIPIVRFMYIIYSLDLCFAMYLLIFSLIIRVLCLFIVLSRHLAILFSDVPRTGGG